MDPNDTNYKSRSNDEFEAALRAISGYPNTYIAQDIFADVLKERNDLRRQRRQLSEQRRHLSQPTVPFNQRQFYRTSLEIAVKNSELLLDVAVLSGRRTDCLATALVALKGALRNVLMEDGIE